MARRGCIFHGHICSDRCENRTKGELAHTLTSPFQVLCKTSPNQPTHQLCEANIPAQHPPGHAVQGLQTRIAHPGIQMSPRLAQHLRQDSRCAWEVQWQELHQSTMQQLGPSVCRWNKLLPMHSKKQREMLRSTGLLEVSTFLHQPVHNQSEIVCQRRRIPMYVPMYQCQRKNISHGVSPGSRHVNQPFMGCEIRLGDLQICPLLSPSLAYAVGREYNSLRQ